MIEAQRLAQVAPTNQRIRDVAGAHGRVDHPLHRLAGADLAPGEPAEQLDRGLMRVGHPQEHHARIEEHFRRHRIQLRGKRLGPPGLGEQQQPALQPHRGAIRRHGAELRRRPRMVRRTVFPADPQGEFDDVFVGRAEAGIELDCALERVERLG